MRKTWFWYSVRSAFPPLRKGEPRRDFRTASAVRALMLAFWTAAGSTAGAATIVDKTVAVTIRPDGVVRHHRKTPIGIGQSTPKGLPG